MIYTDGAAVYQKPNFDSPVQDYLRYETKVKISHQAVAGQGGMGLFHRIRYKDKSGYIADTDVRAAKKEVQKVAPEEKKFSKAWEREDEGPGEGKQPLYFTRFLGGALAMVNFTEKFSGQRLSDNMTMYGLRMMGPGTLFDGPPLDVNVWFSLDKPGYYQKFASGTPTGFLLFGDVMAMFPVMDADNTLVSFGLGLMWVYTRYRVPVKNVTFDSQEFRIGADVGAGVGQRVGKMMIRVDAKYYYEKTQYFGGMLSVLGEY